MTHRLVVDWGSSRLRVTRMPGEGSPETRQAATGASSLIGGGAAGFERAIEDLVGDWLPGCGRIAVSGMATARGGWCETPYLPCPADLSHLDDHAVEGWLGDVLVRFMPGLCDPTGPDVMRGEEVQLAALAGPGRQTVVLPGTHSKWVRLDGHVVVGFRTFMTGEIYDLVLHRSLAGRLADGDGHDPDAFARGIVRGRLRDVFAGLFSARPAVLTGTLEPSQVASYLSGVCIGAEIDQAPEAFGNLEGDVCICGTSALIEKYETAMTLAGLSILRSVPVP